MKNRFKRRAATFWKKQKSYEEKAISKGENNRMI
jgi:hypothetical protein